MPMHQQGWFIPYNSSLKELLQKRFLFDLRVLCDLCGSNAVAVAVAVAVAFSSIYPLYVRIPYNSSLKELLQMTNHPPL